ncbi:hypothetical protein BCY89_04015 [Sphingobacterium siyangense]|uniref:Alcohol dehydrogenase-like N-terminal domain-containing protein n=1 Tax=Sphingobacterium siyangense TaxID=459529 RepID=A0A420FV50_9SPHI|nr:alcohol dehydrogenase catalytic domain-containing protein [Sphingobacterium siyangense]RKF36847.1 hypothetical protein BCY89_04015 [Sphingobacterium siyangense]
MIHTTGYAAMSSSAELAPYGFERQDLLDDEILIDILYCGICHADIHQSKNEYGNTVYPLVPGHEIIGRVKERGSKVTKYIEGDLVGVGYYILSCGGCPNCLNHEEQYCDIGITQTQNGRLPDGNTTKGGYSTNIAVNEKYVLRIPEILNKPGVAPLSEGEGGAIELARNSIAKMINCASLSDKMITAEEGGDAHCGLNNPALKAQVVFDWLEEVLSITPGKKSVQSKYY